MRRNIGNILSLFRMLDEVIVAEIFNEEHTYKDLKKKQYIPYIEKMILDSEFKYESFSSFSIHYYKFSDSCIVCIIGRLPKAVNKSVNQMFTAMNRRDEAAIQSTILDYIFEAIPEVIAFKDTEGYFKYVTKDGEALYPSYETIINKHYSEVYSNIAAKEIEILDEEAYQVRGKVTKIIKIETDFGRRTYRTTRTPLYDSLDNPLGIISINRDITELNQLRAQYDSITTVQETLIDIANSFIDTSQHQFGQVINEALEKIGKAISADRCYIFRYFFEENKMNNAFEWCNKGIEKEIDNLQNVPIIDYIEDWVGIHRTRNNVVIDDVSKLDKDSALYEVLSSQNIKSVLTMPIFTDDECFGFIGFDSVKTHRSWHEIPNLIKILPNLIGNLFSRFYLYKMLYDANEENKKLNHENLKALSTIQSQIRRPIAEIREILSKTKNSEQLLYQIDLIESTTENMTYVNETTTADKSSFSDISLEELLIRIITNNKKYASENNVRLYLDYDYEINSNITSDEGKLTIIIDTILKYLIEKNKDTFVTLTTVLETDSDPYQTIKIGGQVSNQLSAVQTITAFSPINTILKGLNSEIKVRSTKKLSEIFFDITFYIPIHTNALTDLSTLIGFIDLTANNSSNTLSQIKNLYSNVIELNPTSNSDDFNQAYDVVIVHTNNPDYYSSHIKTLMANFNEDVTKILLYENEHSIVYNNSYTYYNHTYTLPMMTNDLLTEALVPKQANDYQSSDGLPGILIIDNNKETFKAITSYYSNKEINTYQAITSNSVKHSDFNNIKVIFIDEYLPLEKGQDAIKELRSLPQYKDTHIYLMSNFVDEGIINDKTHSIKKPLQKKSIKDIINHHIFDKPFKSSNDPELLEVFNQNQFKAFYPKIENQEIMKHMILSKMSILYNQLSMSKDVNLESIHNELEDLALQAHADLLKHYLKNNKTTVDTLPKLQKIIKESLDAIKTTIAS